MLFDVQEKAEVRSAAFELFGNLATFGAGSCKEQFLEQIHTNFVSLLLHLNDSENQVKQVTNCLIYLK
jgi:maestro heat-like repeat-containing protein family member 1